jgi:hypothetical protein
VASAYCWSDGLLSVCGDEKLMVSLSKDSISRSSQELRRMGRCGGSANMCSMTFSPTQASGYHANNCNWSLCI